MSLAMFAASFDDNSNNTLSNSFDNSDNILNQKRHKKTQRKYPKIENFDTNKVNSILQQIHNNSNDDDDDNVNFPPPPESSGVQKTIPTNNNESFGGMNVKTLGKAPSPNYEGSDNLDLNDYNNYGDKKTAEEYYKNVIPGYVTQQNVNNRPYYQYRNPQNNSNNEYYSSDVLIQKLNYMISLLEDQKDEKTNNVTEEVILYSFLGIFIIFLSDTFVRVGKYVR